MRNIKIAPGEYYHIYNRENKRQPIFLDNRDRARFLFIILHFQSPIIIHNISDYVTNYIKTKHRVFGLTKVGDIISSRHVELIMFTLMPNHFHLGLKEIQEGGISRYMQKVLNAYTKYFNTKYKTSGHLFQGPYQAVHMENNTQLLHLSAYIHKNPKKMKEWSNKIDQYPWSSYQDYVKKNRWNELLKPEIILEQFNSKSDYKKFIKTSTAKEE
ncbi:MAG: transposase [Patescibacteria group bacterium]